MAIYRINAQDKIVGCIVARSKLIAQAYAIGRYGASADVSKVSTKDAVANLGICILVETREVQLDGSLNKKVRVIA